MKGFFVEYGKKKPPITREKLTEQLSKVFKGLSLEELILYLTNPFEEVIQYADLSQGKIHRCQKMSLLFNPHRLTVKSRIRRKKGILESLEDETFFSNLARAVLYRRYTADVNIGDLLYRCFEWYTGQAFYAHEFPPHVARDLAIKYGCDHNSKVLDPCAGWGGRMIGISTVTNFYECYDPSTKTYEGLIKLFHFIKQMSPDFVSFVHKAEYEDCDIKENYYDFALTSPLYFDTEIYSDEETNSCNKYPDFDAWVQGFYLPFISKTMRALKPGKSFVLNIGSRVYPLNEVLLDNFSSEYKITKDKNYLSLAKGMGRKGEGETFYVIKNNS